MKVNDWLMNYSADNKEAKIRIFAFPYAGAGPTVFLNWKKSLPPTFEVFAILLPGRLARAKEPLFTSMEQVVQGVTDGIFKETQEKPCIFYGHSTGALEAFEVVRRIRDRGGAPPLHLFVSGTSAPHLKRGIKPGEPSYKTITDNKLKEILRHYGGIPEEFMKSENYLKSALPVNRADLILLQEYTYVDGEPLGIPITYFGGNEDNTEITDFNGVDKEPQLRWRELTTAEFHVEWITGGHFFITTSNYQFLEKLVACLKAYT